MLCMYESRRSFLRPRSEMPLLYSGMSVVDSKFEMDDEDAVMACSVDTNSARSGRDVEASSIVIVVDTADASMLSVVMLELAKSRPLLSSCRNVTTPFLSCQRPRPKLAGVSLSHIHSLTRSSARVQSVQLRLPTPIIAEALKTRSRASEAPAGQLLRFR